MVHSSAFVRLSMRTAGPATKATRQPGIAKRLVKLRVSRVRGCASGRLRQAAMTLAIVDERVIGLIRNQQEIVPVGQLGDASQLVHRDISDPPAEGFDDPFQINSRVRGPAPRLPDSKGRGRSRTRRASRRSWPAHYVRDRV